MEDCNNVLKDRGKVSQNCSDVLETFGASAKLTDRAAWRSHKINQNLRDFNLIMS
ncbi:MAG: hypothetical protein GDA56_13630 [Hormoscilla sp. GM7CHS1pb]|nr:hypothetical protein [Hormoscilla sp. GM7CHS1pb]